MLIIILNVICGLLLGYGLYFGDDLLTLASLFMILLGMVVYYYFYRPRPKNPEEYTKFVIMISKLYAIIESSHVIMEPKMGKYVLKIIEEIYIFASYSMGISSVVAGSYWKKFLDISRKEVENGEY